MNAGWRGDEFDRWAQSEAEYMRVLGTGDADSKPHLDQVYQMKAATHATFINVRRYAWRELPPMPHTSLTSG